MSSNVIEEAQVLIKDRKIDEALSLVKQAARNSPMDGNLLILLGKVLIEKRRIGEALSVLHKAADLVPDSWEAFHFLGDLLFELRRWNEAADAYQRALQLNDAAAWTHLNLSRVYLAQSRLEQVQFHLQKTIDLNPGLSESPIYRNARAMLSHALSRKRAAHEGNLCFVDGQIEDVNLDFIKGWVLSDKLSLSIDILVGNQCLVTWEARVEDWTLSDQDMHRLQFAIGLPRMIKNTYVRDREVTISARLADSGRDLPQSPVVIPALLKCISEDRHGMNPSLLQLVAPSVALCTDCYTKDEVALLVVNRNGASMLEDMFSSFECFNSYSNCEFVIVDHASTDRSLDVCRSWSKKLRVRVLERDKNYSFSESCNYAAAATEAPVLVFLNNDVIFSQDVLPYVVQALQDKSVGVVGLKLYLPSRKQSTMHPVIHHMGVHFGFSEGHSVCEPFESYPVPNMMEVMNSPWRVPAVTGAFLGCRRDDFYAVGCFDEKYRYGYEDVDLCMSIRELLGREIICLNNLSAFHLRGASRAWAEEDFLDYKTNSRLFNEKFAYQLRRKHLTGYFESGAFWTTTPLRLGFIVSSVSGSAAEDYLTAKRLGHELVKQYGWEVFYIPLDQNQNQNQNKEGRSDVYVDAIDVIVVMVEDFDLESLRHKKPSLVKVAWATAGLRCWSCHPWASDYDVVWAASQKSSPIPSNEFARRAELIQVCCDYETFNAGRGRSYYVTDYCLVDSYSDVSRESLYMVNPESLPYSFTLYGRGWESCARLKAYYRGPVEPDDLPDLYASTRIVIDAGNGTNEALWKNVRVFEAIAAGSLVVSNNKEGSDELFDGLIPVFSSEGELCNLISHYMENRDERDELVKKLQEIVVARHSSTTRAGSARDSLYNRVRRAFRIGIKLAASHASDITSMKEYFFAMGMKRAFERAGHSSRIDIIPDWGCRESLGDDVTIVLGGESGYAPKPYHINLMWLLNHPGLEKESEFPGYDRVFADSLSGISAAPHAVSDAALLCGDSTGTRVPAYPSDEDLRLMVKDITREGISSVMRRDGAADYGREGLSFDNRVETVLEEVEELNQVKMNPCSRASKV